MRRKYFILFCLPFLLAGCAEPHGDLHAWMNEQGRGMRGKIDPIPEVQEYEPFTYNAYDMQDPFFPRKIDAGEGNRAGPAPRAPEPLEAYPLDGLRMVGTLERNKVVYGLIQAPGRDIYQVRVGNHMGQDHGRILSITETEIQLRELVQDGAGDWADRLSSLQLVESGKN